MSRPDTPGSPFSRLQFYSTGPYPCSYLADRRAISEVATPPHLINSDIYAQLVRQGFRRSGLFTYRPACEDCHACVPVRLPVKRFQANRSQQRSLKRHATLHARERPLIHSDEHFQLYQRYQAARHTGGGMDEDSQEQYSNFLLQSFIDSRLIEFTENGVLRMVSIIDVLDDGLSSVYTFFDPEIIGASFGTYSILWQIAQCVAQERPYLYLGYWIGDSHKMNYKANFKPIEGLIDGQWQTFNATE